MKEQTICPSCNEKKTHRYGKYPTGETKWSSLCHTCRHQKWGRGKTRPPYYKHKDSQCSSCGFIPVHRCQLDVDHIDMNHKNNAPNNLQTLCANCHRLKTWCERQVA